MPAYGCIISSRWGENAIRQQVTAIGIDDVCRSIATTGSKAGKTLTAISGCYKGIRFDC